jgi:adenylate kinase family enzyme
MASKVTSAAVSGSASSVQASEPQPSSNSPGGDLAPGSEAGLALRSVRDLTSLVRVERVRMRQPGAIILTGPSSCGKGEVAAALCRIMSIRPEAHLSMGEILRSTFTRAASDADYALLLKQRYDISRDNNIFDCVDSSPELTRKVLSYEKQLSSYFNRSDMGRVTSQLEWLEFCTMNGLLVPNRWTQDFIAAHIEHAQGQRLETFILDGYPRTVAAARHLLTFLRRLQVPVLKVLHMSISRQEMIARAQGRGRADDDEASLLSRFQFYIENVQPSVDFMKMELGSEAIALIDAHQPVYRMHGDERVLDLRASIANVVTSALRALGVPRVVLKDLVEDYLVQG